VVKLLGKARSPITIRIAAGHVVVLRIGSVVAVKVHAVNRRLVLVGIRRMTT
jgi:hypothetical protein